MRYLVVSLLLLCSCLSQRATTALFGPARMSWNSSLEETFERGVRDGLEDGVLDVQSAEVLRTDSKDLDLALSKESREDLASVPWEDMSTWVQRGIVDMAEDHELGAGPRVSLEEELAKFTKTINKLKGM